MGAKDCELNVKCGVKHDIGRLLEGKYPLVFGFTNTLPLTDGLTRRKGSLVVVADDTPEQTIVLSGDEIVIIQ